jgi:medium-chain acyl-[acyl-carrier-protein] hydrolase
MRIVQDQWVRGIGSRAGTPTLRLFVFHHAGGSASSYQLAKYFPEDVEVCTVQLPGRENRFAEPAHTKVDTVVEELLPVIESTVDLPYAFFGHSMGALIAFETARQLDGPRHLFVSAHRAPHLPDRNPLRHLSDDEFAARLTATNPVLADPDLREIFLPILRADIELCENYVHAPATPLSCPITALGGRDDDLVPAAELAGWRDQALVSLVREDDH